MTLTPAIKEAYDRVDSYVRNDPCFRYGSGHLCFREDLDALLSVVAAEEGRKYEALVKLHRELRSAGIELGKVATTFPRSDEYRDAEQRYFRAIEALEALAPMGDE